MSATDPDDYLVVYDNRSTGFIEYPGMTLFEFLYDFLCNKIEFYPAFPKPIAFCPEELHVPNVVRRVVAQPVRMDNERLNERWVNGMDPWRMVGDVESTSGNIQDVVMNIDIMRESGGYVLSYWTCGTGCPSGHMGFASLADAERAALEYFDVDSSQWDSDPYGHW